jgi:hypothetical protein
MINVFIALFVEKGLLTEAEGEALAYKMRLATLPADYDSAAKLMKKMLAEVEKGI